MKVAFVILAKEHAEKMKAAGGTEGEGNADSENGDVLPNTGAPPVAEAPSATEPPPGFNMPPPGFGMPPPGMGPMGQC